MKIKFNKILSVISSAVLTAAFTCGMHSDIIPEKITDQTRYVVCASEAEAENWEADVYYVITDELDADDGSHCQWYTTSDISFRTKGIHVKINGKDVTDECYFSFGKGVTPSEVYDGINHDYSIPVTVTPNNKLPVEANIPVKIGLEGDVNLDHIIDVRDSSAMIRDIEYFNKYKVSKLDEFGLYLADPVKDTAAYPVSSTGASTLAKTLAKDALGRATGQKLERKGEESKYSVSLSGAKNALPGETVTLQVVVEADDTFESLDALIEWDDDTLKSAGAVAVNGTLCESYVEDGMLSIIDYSTGNIKDGAIASIEFTVPQEAVPGTNLDVYFSSVETFAVGIGDSTEDVSNVVNVAGASIKVLQPKTTTTTQQTTNVTTTTTTTAVTTSAVSSQAGSAATSASQAVTTKKTTAATVTTTVKATTTTALIVIPVDRGDANLDGTVDIRDAAYIARKLALGEGTMLPDISDYNYDGVKNIRDASAIAKFLALKTLL